VIREVWLSQGAGWRELLKSAVPGLELDAEGSEEGGYRSKRSCKSSMMSCRVATSPGFLSEYRSDTSRTNGVGHELRRAKQPMDDVERALKQRRSSCKT
jgi:hypothetical protein